MNLTNVLNEIYKHVKFLKHLKFDPLCMLITMTLTALHVIVPRIRQL